MKERHLKGKGEDMGDKIDLKSLESKKESVEHWTCNARGTDPFEITINESTGMINVKYCFGSVGSQWPMQKGKFKKFLASVDDGYVTRNFFPCGRHWYSDETRINLNKTVRKAFKEGRIDFNEMREVHLYIKHGARFNDGYEKFLDSMRGCPCLSEIWDYEFDEIGELYRCGFTESVFDIPPNEKFFMKKIWPYVRKIINDEVGSGS